ncbi:MAG: penicillin acylase family protein [Bacteroidales bacterium]|nr:penicillin acylase family protein [Bacteroidales bacterium]
MKILKKIAFVVVFLIVIIAISGYFFLHHIAHKGVPDYNQDINLKNLSEEVIVYRDSLAIPHIIAQNDEDLYRAVGYVMAQDRLWQMDLLRRVTMGRLSEIFGEDFVETDLLLRSLRIFEKSQLILSKTGPEKINALEAYSDGVNQYIEQNEKNLPLEFSILGYKPDKWEPAYSMNIIGYMAWDLAGSAYSSEVILYKLLEKFGKEKIKDLIPVVANRPDIVYPYFKFDDEKLEFVKEMTAHQEVLRNIGAQIFCGSNNWAVSGKKTVSGKPLFANDMHLGLNAPGIWYQMHHIIEGKMNVTGVVVPGQPLIVAGHNDSIAWGMTNLYVDDIDLYLEKINPEDSGKYMFNGEWKDLEVRKEIIKIKGGEEIERELRFTHRGPIISGFKDLSDAISMRWIGNDYSNELRGVYLLNRANNWEDFKNAISSFQSVSQNFAYADADGNIGLYAGGGVPVRKGNGYSIMSGETDEYDWKGVVPFEQLPHSYNPESGFVSSANNKTAGDDYPYYIGTYFSQEYRIKRIRELLNQKEKLSREDFIRIQNDQNSVLVKKLKNDIIEILKEAELSDIEEKALEVFANWDGEMSAEAAGPAVFENFYLTLARNVLLDDMGEDLFYEYHGNSSLVKNFIENLWADKKMKWCDDISTTDKEEGFDEMVVKSYKDVIVKLREKMGDSPERWFWGSIHKFTLTHPLGGVKLLSKVFKLNRGPYEVGGSFHTIRPFSYPFKAPFNVDHGASQRHIYLTDNWDKSLSVIPTGTSGVPASDHYCDQTDLYVNGKYHSDMFSKNMVIKHTKYTMKFIPGE